MADNGFLLDAVDGDGDLMFDAQRYPSDRNIAMTKDYVAKYHKDLMIEGILEELDDWLMEDATPEVMDAGIIALAQRVEHYEIAAYGCARAFAEQLGFEEDQSLLNQTLHEEGEMDKKLTNTAERINVTALHPAHAPHEV